MSCSPDTLKKIEEAFSQLTFMVCIPDLNGVECICQVCDEDAWIKHDKECELFLLGEIIKDARSE